MMKDENCETSHFTCYTFSRMKYSPCTPRSLSGYDRDMPVMILTEFHTFLKNEIETIALLSPTSFRFIDSAENRALRV
jgi:hypothetical protein